MLDRAVLDRAVLQPFIASAFLAKVSRYMPDTMIPEPYELFDINKGTDKVFLIGTSWIVLFLLLL